MLRELFAKKVGLSPRVAAANVGLAASALVWYFLAYSVLRQLIEGLRVTEAETPLVLGINVTCIAVAAIIGSLLMEKPVKRDRFLSLWMFFGIFVSLTPVVYVPSTLIDLLIVSAIFGGYFGLGMPAVMARFSLSSGYESRARLGGIIFLIAGSGFFLFGSLALGDVAIASGILAIVQVVGLLLFLRFKTNNSMFLESRNASYLGVLASRPILLFMVPWCIFNMVNYMTIPVIDRLSQGYELGRSFSLLENIIMAIFAFLAGFLADAIGRKRLAIASFALLGVGYAALGLFQGSFGWYFYTVADGVAWGILYVLFLFTLWGDLAQDQKSEKFYVIGSLPFLFSNFMTLVLNPLISGIPPTALFSFASFFLFLAVLPLFFAPETLPYRIMKAQDLRSYVNKALEKAKKDRGGLKAETSQNQEENPPDYQEAQKLAEKYY